MSFPSILCYVSEENGTPQNFMKVLQRHFKVVTTEEFDKNPAEFSQQIVAIFNFHGKPTVTRELLAKLPKLKIVAVCSAGYNHIDVPMIRSCGVKVSNAPGVLGDSVADFGMLLLLAAGRDFCNYVSIAKAPEVIVCRNQVTEIDVHGSTLGIVGMGEIGFKVAQRACGFNMEVLYHNRRRRSTSDELAVRAEYCESLRNMLPRCDYVIVTVCLTPDTRKMFGEEQFRIMKPSAIFVNIARGAIVDHDALVRALSDAQIKFAALDVTDPEPLPRDHPLLRMPNVIVTPHCCSATEKTRMRMAHKTVDNILAALEGAPLPSEVLE